MPYPLAAARGHDTAQGGAAVPVQQPYLLNFAAYTTEYTFTDRNFAREFSVGVTAICTGLRLKLSRGYTISLRLYRVSDHALLASKTIAGPSGETEQLFDAPITLDAAALYRIGYYVPWSGAGPVIFQGTPDHPDGPIVILTANSYTFVLHDAYPSGIMPWALAIEPIIYA